MEDQPWLHPQQRLRRAVAEALLAFWSGHVAPWLQRIFDDWSTPSYLEDAVTLGLDFRPLYELLATQELLAPLQDAWTLGAEGAAFDLGLGNSWFKTDPWAVAYARERAAEMVGLRRTAQGLEPNPNARWAITPHLRDELHALVSRTMETTPGRPGRSYRDLKAEVESLPEFGDLFGEYRSEMIARSELAIARNQGAVRAYQESRTSYVEVLDNRTCPICSEVAGTVQTVEWAAAHPIGHPHCVRRFVPVDLRREEASRAEGRLP